jgi:hypothetical protein
MLPLSGTEGGGGVEGAGVAGVEGAGQRLVIAGQDRRWLPDNGSINKINPIGQVGFTL